LGPLFDAISLIPNSDTSTVVAYEGMKPMFDELKNGNNGYVYYDGSLTTPPCTEGVDWYLMLSVQNISKEQWERVHNLTKYNVRPVQRNITGKAYIPSQDSRYSYWVWIIVALFLMTVLFFYGFLVYRSVSNKPEIPVDKLSKQSLLSNAEEVQVRRRSASFDRRRRSKDEERESLKPTSENNEDTFM